MPRLPWLLGPYWPMVEIDVVTLSRADSAPHLLHFFPGKCCGERFCESGAEKIVGRVGSKFFRRITRWAGAGAQCRILAHSLREPCLARRT